MYVVGMFLFGYGDEGGVVVVVIVGICMGDYVVDVYVVGVEYFVYGQQGGVFWSDVGVVVIYVDFNLDFKIFFLCLVEGYDGFGIDYVVGYDFEVVVLVVQCQCLVQFGGGYVDGVDDVGDVGSKELFGFFEGGDGDVVCFGLELCLYYLLIFGGFDVWMEVYVQCIYVLLYVGDVVFYV